MADDRIDVKLGVDRTEHHSALAIGARVGRYQIVSVLGQGAFGITYRARDTHLDRDVAIKEYLPALLAVRHEGVSVLPRSTQVSEDFFHGRRQFLDEAKTIARLAHAPAVVRVFDFLEANGTGYAVMQLLEGESLASRLRREPRLPQSAIERMLYPLLDGLEQIHATGFLHRDIKPENIIVGPDDAPTLIDFGASRFAVADRTQLFTAIFTPAYAAPEQFTSERQGPFTDIYGLAATFYACIAGEPPPGAAKRMMGSNAMPSARSIGAGKYAPNLLFAIDVALRLKAEDRPQTIADWRPVFATGTWHDEVYEEATVVLAPTRSALPAARAPSKGRWRNVLPWALVAGVAVIVAGAGYWALDRFAFRAEQQAAEAAARQEANAEAQQRAVASARQQAEIEARQKAEAEAGQAAAADARQKAEAAARQKAEAEARQKAAVEAKQKADADARQKAEAEARQKATADARQRAETEVRQKAEAEARQKVELEAKQKAELEAKQKAELETQQLTRLVSLSATRRPVISRDCPQCPEMVSIPVGSFVMGAAPGEEDRERIPERWRNGAAPLRSVRVSQPFSLGRYEVTRAQYAAFVAATSRPTGASCETYGADGKWSDRQGLSWRNPGFEQTDSDPVVCVSWDDAKAYATWLSRETGKRYRLPSEAEWEYSARASTITARYWGNDRTPTCYFANVADRTGVQALRAVFNPDAAFPCFDNFVHTAPVGRFQANPFGLHDMLGNVWEWVEDCRNPSYEKAPWTQDAWTTGQCGSRVRRGGGWTSTHVFVRSAARSWESAKKRAATIGFRMARTD
ncbi:MAG: SUMF1/EgtB/PvdO family nonheme iron enzyme [Reyranella sp.]|uniref:SUMF1/EgtB/PvdO family nonheme iron enzyme n=1 Tax=Reyranella sp. TaxID=1929291 RepID=UPI003D0A87E7